MSIYEKYKDVPVASIIDQLEAGLRETVRLRNALTQIAEQTEEMQASGEPENGVPEFCRAILRGEDVKLKGILDAPHLS